MNPARFMAILGAICLGLGPFCPAVKIPFQGIANFFQVSPKGGAALLLVALASAALALKGRTRHLPFLTILTLSILIVAWIDARAAVLGNASSSGIDWADGLTQKLGRTALKAARFQWGLWMIVSGLILTAAAGHPRLRKDSAP